MYLYHISFLAKPNLYSSEYEERLIEADMYHHEQMTFHRVKDWAMANLTSELNGLTCINTFSYSMKHVEDWNIGFTGEI